MPKDDTYVDGGGAQVANLELRRYTHFGVMDRAYLSCIPRPSHLITILRRRSAAGRRRHG